MKSVLIVDDELAIAESLALILADEGYEVMCASNGRQGFERAAAKWPDLVLLDFVMPIMNGAEMGQALRNADIEPRIKILMNSSLDEASVRKVFSDYDAFLRKPYTSAQLLDLLARLLK